MSSIELAGSFCIGIEMGRWDINKKSFRGIGEEVLEVRS